MEETSTDSRRVKPNFNKNAQRILHEHFNRSSHQQSSGALSARTSADLPVLAKLDSSAPKSARSHDISYRLERPNFLAPRVPPSLIPKEDYKYEASFLPKDSSSEYRAEDGLWHTAIFPSAFPSSRQDAVLLDQWIGRSLGAVDMGAVTTTDDLLTSVESLVPVLTVGLHEVVRQASHTCRERGIVLERIWTAYVALFGRVLTEMKALLDEQRRKTHALDGELGEVYRELERLRHDHPQHLKDLITHLEDDYKAIQTHLEDTLNDREEENNKLSSQHKAHIADVSHWYPHFSVYQNSTLKNALPTEAAGHLQAAGTSPEVAIADDFKRMVAAFPPDTRRAVGRNLSHVFDDHSAADEATLEALKADLAERTAEVAAMQQKVRELEETRAQLLVSAEVSR